MKPLIGSFWQPSGAWWPFFGRVNSGFMGQCTGGIRGTDFFSQETALMSSGFLETVLFWTGYRMYRVM